MVPARMKAGKHGSFCSFQQINQTSLPFRLGRADAHGQRYPVAPPAKVGGSGQAGQRLRMRGQHLRGALVGDDQELILAPPANLFRGPQSLCQRMSNLLEHCVTGPGPMRPAQLRRLVHFYPHHAERLSAANPVLKLGVQPVFKIRLALCHLPVFAGISMRQRVQALRRMKHHRGADPAAQSVAKNQCSRHHRHFMAQVMTHADQRSKLRYDLGARLELRQAIAFQQRFQRPWNGMHQQVGSRITRDGLGREIPRHHGILHVEQRNAIRKTVQRNLQKFDAIGHCCLAMSFEFRERSM